MKKITIIRPDDWHCHLRDGKYLARTVLDIATRFQRAVIMPNLSSPVTSGIAAHAYRERILQNLPKNKSFAPLMTLYLTEDMQKEVIKDAKKYEFIKACKLYPAHATTHSAHGVHDLRKIYPVLEEMEKQNLLLLIHGESIEPSVDIFDREARFIDTALIEIIKRFSNLRIVLEHISTKKAVDFVRAAPNNVAATITAHHLWFNRNDIFRGGIRPHFYCLPILKRSEDQEALINAATSGQSKFFLGTDSAPHTKSRKETSCGCAGIYSAHAAIELYAQVFEKHNALPKLEQFASINGAAFYGLPINQEKITLVKKSWQIPKTLNFGDETLVPMLADEKISWQIKNLEPSL